MSKGAKQGKTKMDGVMRKGNHYHCHYHCKAKAKANIGMSVQKMGNGTTLFYRTIHCQEDINLLKNFPF
jgi:hypothetical protein